MNNRSAGIWQPAATCQHACHSLLADYVAAQCAYINYNNNSAYTFQQQCKVCVAQALVSPGWLILSVTRWMSNGQVMKVVKVVQMTTVLTGLLDAMLAPQPILSLPLLNSKHACRYGNPYHHKQSERCFLPKPLYEAQIRPYVFQTCRAKATDLDKVSRLQVLPLADDLFTTP